MRYKEEKVHWYTKVKDILTYGLALQFLVLPFLFLVGYPLLLLRILAEPKPLSWISYLERGPWARYLYRHFLVRSQESIPFYLCELWKSQVKSLCTRGWFSWSSWGPLRYVPGFIVYLNFMMAQYLTSYLYPLVPMGGPLWVQRSMTTLVETIEAHRIPGPLSWIMGHNQLLPSFHRTWVFLPPVTLLGLKSLGVWRSFLRSSLFDPFDNGFMNPMGAPRKPLAQTLRFRVLRGALSVVSFYHLLVNHMLPVTTSWRIIGPVVRKVLALCPRLSPRFMGIFYGLTSRFLLDMTNPGKTSLLGLVIQGSMVLILTSMAWPYDMDVLKRLLDLTMIQQRMWIRFLTWPLEHWSLMIFVPLMVLVYSVFLTSDNAYTYDRSEQSEPWVTDMVISLTGDYLKGFKVLRGMGLSSLQVLGVGFLGRGLWKTVWCIMQVLVCGMLLSRTTQSYLLIMGCNRLIKETPHRDLRESLNHMLYPLFWDPLRRGYHGLVQYQDHHRHRGMIYDYSSWMYSIDDPHRYAASWYQLILDPLRVHSRMQQLFPMTLWPNLSL